VGCATKTMRKKAEHLVGYALADKPSHPVEGIQCICAERSSLLELMKFNNPNTLTAPTYLEMLKKSLV
jgi:hypothetical protein